MPGAEQHRYDADVVLTGQVVDRREAGGDATYTIHVDRVYRGSARAWQEVVTASQGSACGLSLTIGEPVLLLAGRRSGSDQLTSGGCGGSGGTTTAPAELGAGRPPGPAASPAAVAVLAKKLGWVAVTAELIVLGVVAVIVAELVVLVRTRHRRAKPSVPQSPA